MQVRTQSKVPIAYDPEAAARRTAALHAARPQSAQPSKNYMRGTQVGGPDRDAASGREGLGARRPGDAVAPGITWSSVEGREACAEFSGARAFECVCGIRKVDIWFHIAKATLKTSAVRTVLCGDWYGFPLVEADFVVI